MREKTLLVNIKFNKVEHLDLRERGGSIKMMCSIKTVITLFHEDSMRTYNSTLIIPSVLFKLHDSFSLSPFLFPSSENNIWWQYFCSFFLNKRKLRTFLKTTVRSETHEKNQTFKVHDFSSLLDMITCRDLC